MTNYSRFQKGSGVYKCRCCGKPTRDTAGDAVNCQLCAECFEVAGCENEVQDGIEGGLERLKSAVEVCVKVRGCLHCEGALNNL